MSVIAYVRVSSNKQTNDHQRYEIKKFATKEKLQITTWVEETISSRKALQKRKLGGLLDVIESGDILISCEISRLGRSILDVMHILEKCLNKNCQVWTIKENYRLGNDIQSKVMAFAFGLAAEIERNLISQRTKSSLDNLKSEGKKLGRPLFKPNAKLKLSGNNTKIISLWSKGFSKSSIAKVLGVGRATLLRYISRSEDLQTLGEQKTPLIR